MNDDPYASRTLDQTTEVSAFRLDGRVAVVIGGTGVLCGNIAETFALAGAQTVIVGRDPAKAEAVLDRMRTLGVPGTFQACDTTSREQLHSLVEHVVATHGGIDVVVNGAGVNAATPFLDVADEELERIVASNQLAVFRACQEFGRYFVARAQTTGIGASIINIGSVSGLTPLSRVFTYSMTKAAVHNLTKNLAREWGPIGIRCNVLVPGFFPAEQNRKILSADRVASILGHTPMARFGAVSELGGAALLLASDAGRFITGTELIVDGGFSSTTI